MPKPKVSVIIPALNEEKLIRACLESVLSNTKSDEVEIIVIDNGSSDSTISIAREFDRVNVLVCAKSGVMNARQKGLEESRGDIIAFLDADNRITPNWIEKIESSFAKDPTLVCISGPYKYYDISPSKQFLASVFWNICVYTAYAFLGYVGNFGNMAIKKSTLDKMGGLDTSIVFYGDDTNTAKRAGQFGRMKYDLMLVVWSSGRRFAKQGLLRTTFVYTANFFSQVFLKHSVSKEYKGHR